MEAEDDYSRLCDYIDTWLKEKSEHVLTGLVLLYEDFRRREDLPKEFVEDFLFGLGWILHDSTKILSFSSNSQWSPEDEKLILEKGKDGLDEVLVKYGLLDKDRTAEARRKSQIANLNKIDELLSEPRDLSRTLINELLDELLLKMGVRDPIVDKISELTEKVNMGDLLWSDYVDSAGRLIKDLKAKYCDQDGTVP